MLKTLRSRLLTSYFIVIIIALVITAVALFFSATSAQVRFLPALQQLATIGQTNRTQLQRLLASGAGQDELIAALDRTAAANNVRIAIASTRTGLIFFDTAVNQSWLNLTLEEVERPARLVACAEEGNVGGVYQAPNGQNWLVCSQIVGAGRIIYAQPAPTRFFFFRQFYLRPLAQAGVVALFISILLALWITRSVNRPLQQTVYTVEAVAAGEYEPNLPRQGPEEVQRVITSVNHMAARVNASQQAQRDFVANVSHDLKTPITAIRGWSQALLDGTAVSADEQQQAATIIHSEAGRMLRMTEQLLDLARIEGGQFELKKESVDLHQLITDVHHTLQPYAQAKQIHLTLESQPVPPILGDYDRLMQLFTNLVDNALTHTKANGRVHLCLQPHEAGWIKVTVQDSGKGIPPDQLTRIFERFYQVDKSRQGAGLGLAIVKELVEGHNGRIEAHSHLGQGSHFLVYLPIHN